MGYKQSWMHIAHAMNNLWFCFFSVVDIGLVHGEILIAPRDVEIQIGGTAIFECSSSHQSFLRWRHAPYPGDEYRFVNINGDMISVYADRYSIHTNCSVGRCDLVIRDVQRKDAGSFCCYDDGGRGPSNCSDLTVIGQFLALLLWAV